MRQSSLKCMQCLEMLLFGHGQQVQVPRPPTYTFILNIIALFNLHIYKRAELIGNVTVHNVTAK